MFNLVNACLFPSHWCAIHIHPLPAFHFHYLMWIVCLHFICFCLILHGCWSTFIETHSVFVFTLSLNPPPSLPSSPLSPTHQIAASQSKAQKKLQPLTQVPVLQEQGEYCAGVVGVWTWVPAVWLGCAVVVVGEGCCFHPLSPSCFNSVSQLSSFRSPPGMVCAMASLSSLSHCPREMPHTPRASTTELEMWGSLWCVCLWAPEECSNCVCCQLGVFSAVLTHTPSNAVMLLLVYKAWSISQSVTDPQQEESH